MMKHLRRFNAFGLDAFRRARIKLLGNKNKILIQFTSASIWVANIVF